MKKWQKHERTTAKSFNSKVNKGSGNQWYNPSDIRTEEYLLEAKQTDKKSYSISLNTWNKLADEAGLVKKIPALVLRLQETDLIIISKDDFLLQTKKKAS